jgi:hypothetical protein
VIRSQLENGGGGLAQLDREAAERRAAEDAEIAEICRLYPDLAAKYCPARLPERDQAHRKQPLAWSEHSPGRGPGQAQLVQTAAGPPQMSHHNAGNASYSNGVVYQPSPRPTVVDVTPQTGLNSVQDRHVAALVEAEVQKQLRIRMGAGSVSEPVAAAKAEPAPVGLTSEQLRQRWEADAYRDAVHSQANADGSGWARTAIGVR